MLLDLQMEFYLQFQKAHLGIIIENMMFDAQCPFFVNKMKEHNVCYCIYHVEMNELQIGLNNMCTTFGIHSNYGCNWEEFYQSNNLNSFICDGSLNTYLNLTSLWESVVYPREELSKWHARECLLGECENCGVDNLPICPIEKNTLLDFPISWKHFSLETIVTKKGKGKKKLKLVYKTTSLVELITYLKPKL